MVTAKEVFGQYYERSPPVQKSMQSVPPPVAKGGMAAVVGAAAAVGYALMPSRHIPVNLVGAALTGGLGVIGRNRLGEERQKAAVPAVAALLSEGLGKASADSLGAIADEYGVPKSTFQSQLADLYLAYLNACLTSHAIETTELSELLRLSDLLRISAQQVGAQTHAAARQLYSRHRAYLEDEGDNDSKLLLRKVGNGPPAQPSSHTAAHLPPLSLTVRLPRRAHALGRRVGGGVQV